MKGLAILIVIAIICAGFVIVSRGAEAQSFDIYEEPETGDTVAADNETGEVVIRGHYAGDVIQQAIDASNGGSILIAAGDYDISTMLYSYRTSIRGEGNSTRLLASADIDHAVIMIGKSPGGVRPNGLTISDLQIDCNKSNRAYGDTMEGIGLIDALNCHVLRVYVHSVLSGQGVYLANSQGCTVKDSWIEDIGNNLGSGSLGNYGSGIAFGEARTPASSNCLIDNVTIESCSMSSIDLEPANHITITNCRFMEARTWKNIHNAVITLYTISGYAANDHIIIANNYVKGSFGEFVILSDTQDSVIADNYVEYTASYAPAIYAMDASDCEITSNIIGMVSKDAITGVNCGSFQVSGNTITDMTGSRSDYGLRFLGTSGYNVIDDNDLTGWQYAITANEGAHHSTITDNTVHDSTVGIKTSGIGNIITGNELNGASVE